MTARLGIAVVLLFTLAAVAAVAQARADGQEESRRLGFMGFEGEYDRVVGPKVLVIRVEGIIDRAMEEYISLGIAKAEEMNAPLVVMLNTPGGLLDSAMNIVWAIDRARVPVIGFVAEGWAMSAGTMILVSSHVAAMAPGTQIGSMQPVAYDPASGSYRPINESKIINAILEFLNQHAVSKGRNKTVIFSFVTNNTNLGAEAALRSGVIEFVAGDLGDLIRQINGSIVGVEDGRVKLALDGSYVEYRPGLRITLLHILSDPIISSVLLTLGTLIILFTLASGHAAFTPIGAILLLLGLAGTGFNPNVTAIALLLLGAILIIVEMYTPGFGVIGGSGIVMIILGVALMPVSAEGFTVTVDYANRFLYTVYGLGGIMGTFTAIAVYKIIQVRRRRPVTWGIEGARGRALDRIEPGKPGFVLVEGEYWKAVSDEVIEPGTEVVVIEKRGSMLHVRPAGSR